MAPPFDASKVPVMLRGVAPWAERFGLGDSVERSEALKATTLRDLQEFVLAVAPFLEHLRAWTSQQGASAEALALSYLASACDEAMGEIVIHPAFQARIDLLRAKLHGQAHHRSETTPPGSEPET